MPLNHHSDGLPSNLRRVFDMQERLEATTNPFGKMQKQLALAAKLPVFAPPAAWLDIARWDNLARFPKQLDEAFQNLTQQTRKFTALSQNLASLQPVLPLALLEQVTNLGLAQNRFFGNWSSLAVAFERPQWLQQVELLQTRFDGLLAELAAEPAEADEVAASVTLGTEVFALGNDLLAAPAAVGTSQLQLVLAACNRFLAATVSPAAKQAARDFIVLLTFLALVHDKWKEMHPVPAAPAAGEVLLHEDLKEQHLQVVLRTTQEARDNGQLRVATRTIRLNSRPSAKAPAVGRLLASTELTPGGQVRAWVYVSGFDTEGELLEGWVPTNCLAAAEASSATQATKPVTQAARPPAASQNHPRRARKTAAR